MPDDTSLFDHFGREWTLLAIDPANGAAEAFKAAAEARNLSLKVLDLTDNPVAADLYVAPAALIRPDQHVAWRGDVASMAEADQILSTVLGAALAQPSSQVA